MDIILVSLFIVSSIILLLSLVSGKMMLWKIPMPISAIEWSGRKDQADTGLSQGHELVSIVIPARNEEKRIVPLLQSLQNQKHIQFELLVVDDASTDKTAAIARSYGAKVIHNRTLDQQWTGKSAACWAGVQEAEGSLLLFLDADTRMTDETSLARLLATYRQVGSRGILSLQPYHSIKQAYENASAVFNIIVMVGMNVFTVWGNRFKGAGAFGPCLLCSREDYDKAGGHEKIKEAVMDDLALGIAMQEAGLPVHCYGGKGLIDFRMYPEGWLSLWQGWTKSFATASRSTHAAVMTLINLWISGGMVALPFVLAASLYGSPFWVAASLIGYAAYLWQFYRLARRTGRFHFYPFLVYPLLLLFFTILFLWSLYLTKVKRSVVWRGRKLRV